jgi:hypothetical protein
VTGGRQKVTDLRNSEGSKETATTTTVFTDRRAVPDGPPKLTPAQLRQVQLQTLDAPRLRYSCWRGRCSR